MRTILVDAIGTLVKKEAGIVPLLYELLESYPNPKIILTNANDAEMAEFLPNMPYEVFTLKHDPEKTNPEYYRNVLTHFSLRPENVLYIEHNPEAVGSARSVGIETHQYVADTDGYEKLKSFLLERLP